MEKKNNDAVASHAGKATWLRQVMMALLVLVALGFQTACDDDDDGVNDMANSNLYAIDREYLINATQSNLSEIEFSQLALQKSTDEQVRGYATMMINEHTTAHNELKALADNKKWKLGDKLDDVHQAQKDQLNELAGTAFDQAYLKGQVTGHQKTSAAFQMEIDNGRDNELKAYAAKYKPAVDMHYQNAQALVITKGFNQ